MRRALLRTHLIASLIFGLFIVAISTTGSLLVLEGELERLFSPLPYHATEGGVLLETLRQKAKAAYPGFQVDRITLPEEDGLYQLRLIGQENSKAANKNVYADPGTGEVLGEVKPRSAFYDTTLKLHRWLLLQDVLGRNRANLVTGTVGAGFLVVLGTGAFLWWPGLRRFASGFKVVVKKG